jgi:uncharacterized protein YcsI (UPF0317 family)
MILILTDILYIAVILYGIINYKKVKVDSSKFKTFLVIYLVGISYTFLFSLLTNNIIDLLLNNEIENLFMWITILSLPGKLIQLSSLLYLILKNE